MGPEVVARHLLHEGHLSLRFYPFDQHLGADFGAEHEERSQCSTGGAAELGTDHDLAVDFQIVERDLLKHGEADIPRTYIIEGDRKASSPEGGRSPGYDPGSDDSALGYLDYHTLRTEVGSCQFVEQCGSG